MGTFYGYQLARSGQWDRATRTAEKIGKPKDNPERVSEWAVACKQANGGRQCKR